ncbi:MAG TPA: hypothetical protein VLQ52_04040, partial [Coriobacteriia bacterium]|nr:hypothetical protein [Coriobacteriia bacterium]
MSRPISRPAIIGALLKKELTAYSRDFIYLGLTLVVLIMFPILFHILPDSVDETIAIAVSPPVEVLVADAREVFIEMGATEEQLAQLDELDLNEAQEGLLLVEFEDEEQMSRVVEGTLEAWESEAG